MKSLAFYNHKGGSGKTSFTILFASFLAYKHNKKVLVVDFDENSLTRYRKAEKQYFTKAHPTVPIREDIWKILEPDGEFIEKAERQNLPAYAYWIANELKKEEYRDTDIVLYDFPAHVNNVEANQLIGSGFLGICVIPFDKEYEQMIHGVATASSIMGAKRISPKIPTRVVGFINCIQSFAKKTEYISVMNYMHTNNKKEKNVRIDALPDMISFSERMKKLHGVDTLRTTISYPDWESPDFKGSKDLGLDNLFVDLTRLLKDSPDFPGTTKADFSFADTLEKNTSIQSLNRQLNGSDFPEFEIELPEDMKYNFKRNY